MRLVHNLVCNCLWYFVVYDFIVVALLTFGKKTFTSKLMCLIVLSISHLGLSFN